MQETVDTRTGSCACGAVRYRADCGDAVRQCHCENCRRLSGNFVAAVRAESATIEWTDPDGQLGTHQLDYAHYGFCRSCGSTLYFRSRDEPELSSIMTGTLDDATGLWLLEVWFAHEAQPHNPLPAVPLIDGNA